MIPLRRVPVLVVAFVLAASALNGCSDDANAKPDDCTLITGDEVTIAGTVSGWDPECLEVRARRTIAFTAELGDDEPHNLEVSGPGLNRLSTGSPVRGGPLTLRVPLEKAGYYQFVCTIHASMEGSLYVGQ